MTQKGIVKLNNATDSTSTTEAATPSAVKAAMDKANAAAPASHIHA
ncbi:tail fiber protein [Salmonella enterica]